MAEQTRDIVAIRSELEAAQREYHETAGDMVEKDWRLLSDYITKLRMDLNAALTEGAVPCSRCGAHPHGLRHVRAVTRAQQVQWKHVYEVGCINCYDGWQWVRDDAPEDEAPPPPMTGHNEPYDDVPGWRWMHIDRRGWGETPYRDEGGQLDKFAERAAREAVEEWNTRNQRHKEPAE
jgi:hypothetical protein